jgi:hypothetical protein
MGNPTPTKFPEGPKELVGKNWSERTGRKELVGKNWSERTGRKELVEKNQAVRKLLNAFI